MASPVCSLAKKKTYLLIMQMDLCKIIHSADLELCRFNFATNLNAKFYDTPKEIIVTKRWINNKTVYPYLLKAV